MAKRILLLLAIIGSILFWSAFIAEISLRYVNVSSSFDISQTNWEADEQSESEGTGSRDGFLILFVLVTLAVSSTSYLTYQITKRNQLTHQHTSQSTSRRRSQRQTQGNKSSFKTTREKTTQSKSTRVSRSKNTATSGSSERANASGTTGERADSSKANEASGVRVKGRVRVYYPRRSYGFVEDENKHTIFFHKSAINADIDERDLTKKPNVSYKVTPSDRGPIATDIQLEQ